MPRSSNAIIPTCLREARANAGYASRGAAATAVPFSPETIGRHERGEVEITPQDVITYSDVYERPDLPFRFCMDCPVGKRLGKRVTDRDLHAATNRLSYNLDKVSEMVRKLRAIAFDNIIDDEERPVFDSVLRDLLILQESIADLALLRSKEKAPRMRTHPKAQRTKEFTSLVYQIDSEIASVSSI